MEWTIRGGAVATDEDLRAFIASTRECSFESCEAFMEDRATCAARRMQATLPPPASDIGHTATLPPPGGYLGHTATPSVASSKRSHHSYTSVFDDPNMMWDPAMVEELVKIIHQHALDNADQNNPWGQKILLMAVKDLHRLLEREASSGTLRSIHYFHLISTR